MKYYQSADAWETPFLLFHALPRVNYEGLSIAWAESPAICLGIHQEVDDALNRQACEEIGIHLLRRESGGGLFPLSNGTLLYQIVVRQQRLQGQASRDAKLHALLAPLIETCRALGLRIGPTDFGRFRVGDRLLFRSTLMEYGNFVGAAAYLHLRPLPDRLLALLRESSPGLSLADAGLEVHRTTLARYLREESAAHFGPLETAQPDATLRHEMEGLAIRLLSPAWVLDRGRIFRRQSPLARTGILPRKGSRRTEGGTIHTTVQFDEDLWRILSVVFGGDFFVFPTDGLSWLENALENCPYDEVGEAIRRVYRLMPLETPGITPEDWVIALNLPD